MHLCSKKATSLSAVVVNVDRKTRNISCRSEAKDNMTSETQRPWASGHSRESAG
jgi:hypothetical protein